MATYTDLKQLGNDWQLYNYNPSSRDEYRGLFTHNPLQPMGQHAGPSMDGLMPQYWGDILNANADLLRQRGYTGSFDLRGDDATQGDVSGLVDWMKNAGLVVGQSGPLKDGSAKHGSYYTQLFDTSGGGYNPIGVGTQVTNDYGEEGMNLAKIALAALGGAALNGGFTAPPDGGTSIGLGGSMGGAGWAPSSVVNPAIGETVGQSIAASLGGAGAGSGLLGAGTAGTAGAGGLLGGASAIGGGGIAQVAPTAAEALTVSAPAVSTGASAGGGLLDGLFTNTKATNPALIDSALGTTGYGASSASTGLMDWLGGNWKDLAKVGLSLYGANEAKDQTQAVNRDPWGPAQPYILANLQRGQQLQEQLAKNPFTEQQQAAYNNIGGLLNAINQNAGGLLGGYQAAASGANNYDRSNPRKALTGSAPVQTNWMPGLLNFFPKAGG